MTLRRFTAAAGPALLAALLTTAAPSAAAPLLVEGKSTVYQRVLTRPGAALHPAPGDAQATDLTPFEPFYVFERDGDWLRVGHLASQEPQGWVEAAQTVEWRQNITAVFTNPANRSRQLMFDSADDLRRLMEHEDLQNILPVLVTEADSDSLRDGTGVLSVEPAEHVDIADNFYLMPILDFSQEYHPLTFDPNVLIEVASLPLRDSPDAPPPGDFDVGVVFVIDTTQSMDAYFPLMQAQVQSLVSRIEGSEVGSRINFGIVAFRDELMPGYEGLEYRVREMLPLERRDSQQPVIDALRDLEEAQANSPGFNEDSLAAIDFALENVDWGGGGDPFDGRFVVLITDAGPKLPGQGSDAYRNTPQDLQVAAEAQGTAVLAVHLMTPGGGAANHDFAATQYRALTRFGGRDHYFPIAGGAAEAFEGQSQLLLTFFKDQVLQAQGQQPELSDEQTGQALSELGRAIRLQYLGSERGASAPDVFRSWLSMRAVEDPRRQAASFRLLVTRNELATMADLTAEMIRIGNAFQTEGDITSFFEQIRETILRMSQDPNRLVDPSAEGPGDAMEFLEDLPYQSEMLRMSEASWTENPGERRVILDKLQSKLRSYQRWLSSPDVWVPLFDDAPDSEWVTAMPIEFLP